MQRSPSAHKLTVSNGSRRPQMDWIGLLNLIVKRGHQMPLRWTRVESGMPTRTRPWKIREKLRATQRGLDLQIRQVPSGVVRTGDVQPVEWMTNDFEVDRGLVQLERQKTKSGEKLTWETWVRIAPPAEFSPIQKARQDKYTKEQRSALEFGEVARTKVEYTEDEVKEDEFAMMRNWKERDQARRDWHFEKLDRIIDVRQAYRDNRRIGEPGLKEWRVADALRRIRESRERHQAFANGRSKS